ncbi:MAG: hypothetical protein B7Y43_02445 [Sphingomonas sp. 28-62-20]|uniref:hypothetical protein n=1 Tax=Sphingomonas sp. 28-62-20 TaxID=1970433 RepID=UPI000BCB9102|nr:MAG: hypothetical protein B7Y43_02445 [Sphingomonas sp. 28-62-20]
MTAPSAPLRAGQPRSLAVGHGAPTATARLAQVQLLRSIDGGEAALGGPIEAEGVLRLVAIPGSGDVTYRPGLATAVPLPGHHGGENILAIDPRGGTGLGAFPPTHDSSVRRSRVMPVDPLGARGGVRWLRWGVAVLAVLALVALVARLTP